MSLSSNTCATHPVELLSGQQEKSELVLGWLSCVNVRKYINEKMAFLTKTEEHVSSINSQK